MTVREPGAMQSAPAHTADPPNEDASAVPASEADAAGTFAGRVVVMFGTQLFGAAAGIVNGILLARLLGPAGKGDYALLILLPATAMVLLQLGLPLSFLYHAARGETRGMIAKSLVLAGLLSAAGLCALVVLLPALQGAVFVGAAPMLFLVALAALPFSLHATFSAAIVMGRQAVRWYATVNVANPLVSMILIILVLGGLGASVPGAVAIYLVVAIINALWYLAGARSASRAVPAPGRASYRQLVRYGLQYYPGSLAGFFTYRVDVYLIAFFVADPSEPLGYYTMAVGLAEMVFLFERAVSYIFFPHVSGSSREDADRQVALVTRVTLLGAAILAVMLVPAAAVMIWTVLPAFGPSIPPLLVLLPGVVALCASHVVGGYVSGIGRPGLASLVTLIALAVNIAANVVLIPRFGIVGAAAASLVSYTLSSVVLTVMAARFSGTPVRRFWIPGPSDARLVLTTGLGLLRTLVGRSRRQA